MKKTPIYAILTIFLLTACDNVLEASYPKSQELQRADRRGKLTGDGLTLGGSDDDENGGNSPIGVNSFLWRATLDTIAFMPLVSADPFGGVVLTDWYEDPAAKSQHSQRERFKLNILILDRQLRSDGLKVTTFRQVRDVKTDVWQDVSTNPDTARQIEDSILTRARELRVKQDTK